MCLYHKGWCQRSNQIYRPWSNLLFYINCLMWELANDLFFQIKYGCALKWTTSWKNIKQINYFQSTLHVYGFFPDRVFSGFKLLHLKFDLEHVSVIICMHIFNFVAVYVLLKGSCAVIQVFNQAIRRVT